METGIFLTVRDLMKVTGSYSYFGTAKAHRNIRDAISLNKRKITIQEYCKYEGISFDEIWAFLRTKPEKKHNPF
jgi:hypothetical protein